MKSLARVTLGHAVWETLKAANQIHAFAAQPIRFNGHTKNKGLLSVLSPSCRSALDLWMKFVTVECFRGKCDVRCWHHDHCREDTKTTEGHIGTERGTFGFWRKCLVVVLRVLIRFLIMSSILINQLFCNAIILFHLHETRTRDIW